MERLAKQVSFIGEIEKLKAVTRFNRTLDKRFENSAEHSWQVAIVATLLKEYYPSELNLAKVITMLLLHDLGEIYAGDTWVFDETGKASSQERELRSIKTSLGKLPQDQSKDLQALWQEFEHGDSDESRYARAIDAITPLINHLVVSENNYNPDKLTSQMVLQKKAFIQQDSEILWQLVESLVDASVEKGLYLS
ncbi:hydrolase [Bacilli bacterium]|nr:hydrolase [Bacilli bacterium]GHU42627.1 hydrolase [Bacilli bacterium]GHU45756.1 hydrolase [Bacilli bacterium]